MKKSILALALAGLLVAPATVLATTGEWANEIAPGTSNGGNIETPADSIGAPLYDDTEKLGQGFKGVEVVDVNGRTGRAILEFNNSGKQQGWVEDQKNTPVEHAFTNEDVKYQNLFVTAEYASQYASRYANGRSVEILPVHIEGVEYFYVVFGETAAPVADATAKEGQKASEGKKEAKAVKAADTKTGAKTLPKTSAAK